MLLTKEEMIDSGRFNKKGIYCVPIAQNTRIHTQLGRVKMKNDGRWSWVRWRARDFCHEEWNGNNEQGVESTQKEAEKRVLDGWN